MKLENLQIKRFSKTEKLEIGIFSLDTNQSIRDRIAYIAGVYPKYIYIEPNNKKAYSLWEPESIATVNAIDFYETFKEYFSGELILTFWLNFYIQNDLQLQLVLLEAKYPNITGEFIDTPYESVIEFAREPYHREMFQTQFLDRIKKFQDAQAESLDRLNYIESIPEIPMTYKKSNDVVLSGSFTTPGNSLEYIFDTLNPTRDVPIISYNQYYKIHPHYKFERGWISMDERVRIKINIDGYDSELNILKNDDDDNFEFSTEPFGVIDPVVYQQIVEELLEAFNPKLDKITQYYYHLETRINIEILSDILMTNPVFEPMFAMNNRRAITNEYGDHRIYFKNMLNSDFKPLFFQLLQTNTNTARFIITSSKHHDTIRELFGKLLRVYTDVKHQVIADYRRYAIFIEDRDIVDQVMPVEQNIEPITEIEEKVEKINYFDAGWTSKCQPTTRHPIMLSENEKQLVDQLDFEILRDIETRLKQPKATNKKIPLLSDPDDLREKYRNLQIQQFPKDSNSWFICVHPDYPFPGVLKNEKSALGFQPCCFKTDKRNSAIYRAYYENVQREVVSTFVITKDKIITRGALGEFSEITKQHTNNITKCLRNATKDTDEHVLRFGTQKSPNSFLECVLVGLGLEYENLPDIRQTLLDGITPNFLKQELFGYSEDEIREYVLDPELFLNPLSTVRLLEEKYQCNILIFRRDEKFPSGTLSLPYHTRGYMKTKRDTTLPTIMVYMHTGSETGNLDYPHCELLVHVPVNIKTYKRVLTIPDAFSFEDSSPVASFCWNIYNAMGYIQNGRNTLELEPLNTDEIVAQYIDEYGKMCFILGTDGRLLNIPPYPPLNVELLDINAHLTDGERTRDTNQNYITTGSAKLYTTHLEEDVYRNVDENEKLARAINEWLFYLYSKHGDDIDTFLANYITIDDNVKYNSNELSPLFDESKSGGIIQGGKLVCSSNKYDNIEFQLRREAIRRPARLKKYKEQTLMNNYYNSILDFKYNEKVNIFTYDQTSDVSFMKTVHMPGAYRVYDYPQNKHQYYLKHPMVMKGSLVYVINSNQLKDIVPLGMNEPSLEVVVFKSELDVMTSQMNQHPNIPTTSVLVTKFDGQVLFGRIKTI